MYLQGADGQCTIYVVYPEAEIGGCPFKVLCSEVNESLWSEVRTMVEKKEVTKMNNSALNFEAIETRREEFLKILTEETIGSLTYQCNNYKIECPSFQCPFKKPCSDISMNDWEDVLSIVLNEEYGDKKMDNMKQQEEITLQNSAQHESKTESPLVHSNLIDNYLDSYKALLRNKGIDVLTEICSGSQEGIYCSVMYIDAPCPFRKSCSQVVIDDWLELDLYIAKKARSSNMQDDNTNESKEPTVRCYYAYMMKEEKIVFYKGVFTRRKTIPVAFTSESQRDLFILSTECSYAVSRRQLLHELADAYQDRCITELSRVISEIRRRAITATNNSNGAITYSDYRYFDMNEIIFDC